jgi:hypothetical protein
VVAALLLTALLSGTPPVRDEASRHALLTGLAQRPLLERLGAVSEAFLETPYQVSPLGEGSGQDPDPRVRFDAVDCLTFVEQTIALSLAAPEVDAIALLDRIRYGGEISYAGRNHLMEAQWLPSNLSKGFLRDVTRQYGGNFAVEVAKVITSATWSGKRSTELALPLERQPTGTFRLPSVPLDRALEAARKVPEGTILVVIRDDLPLMATRVSHLGFVFHRKGRPVLRHAARTFGRVVDEDLESFLLRNSRYAKWKVTGVAFYEVVDPRP